MKFIKGTAAADTLYDTVRTENIRGLKGDDTIINAKGGDDLIHGNEGQDYIEVTRKGAAVSTVTVYGDQNDDLIVWNSWNASTGYLDGGDGSDAFAIRNNVGAVSITTGAGPDWIVLDALSLKTHAPILGSITITDFGAEDSVAWTDFLVRYLRRWDGNNPFATGHARLVQVDDDVVLQLNQDGRGDDWIDVVTFADTTVASFTAEQFGGYDPAGGAPVGQTIIGDGDDEFLVGTVGNDLIFGRGGDDFIYDDMGDDIVHAGRGADTLYCGLGDDRLYGGDDNDTFIRLDRFGADFGSDTLYGEGGDDVFLIDSRASNSVNTIQAFGGLGSDYFVYSGLHRGPALLDGGDGDDVFQILACVGQLTITTGAGSDAILLDDLDLGYSPTISITVTDFQAGDGGDLLSLLGLYCGCTGVDANTDLIAEGYLRVVQDGADARLQYDLDGGGDDFVDFVILQNVDVTTLTEANFYP